MTTRDSLGYEELRRAYRNNLGWIGLNDSEREVLALLLTEEQWTDNSLSPEDIANVTGLARSTISAILSKLMGLGLIESILDSTDTVIGRRKTYYRVRRGLSGIIIFGIRRLVVELQNLQRDVNAAFQMLDKKEHAARDILRISIEEAGRNLLVLNECLERIPVEQKASTDKR